MLTDTERKDFAAQIVDQMSGDEIELWQDWGVDLHDLACLAGDDCATMQEVKALANEITGLL